MLQLRVPMKVAFVGMRMVLLIISAHFVAAGEKIVFQSYVVCSRTKTPSSVFDLKAELVGVLLLLRLIS